jgi:hypothetical protein
MFVASVFTTGSNVAAREPVDKHMSGDKPIEGVAVTITNTSTRPVRGLARQTDAEGNFTVGDLTTGTYEILLKCGKCQSMSIESGVQFKLTAPKESDFKTVISKRELVAGAKFRFEIGGSENKQHGPYTGKVTLVR